ncbi:MAG: phosphotransferase [Thermodesulfobacteriota bacterium]
MPSLIEDLLEPISMPERTSTVRLIQTHISLIFVTDEFVYKVKKPVDFGFLDFTTLEKRRYYCEREVALNSRLSSGVYLGVVPITHDGRRYRIGGRGDEALEYAVKMRKIPEEMLMKALLLGGALEEGQLRSIAAVLARFHLEAENSPEIDRFGEPESFRVNTDENFAQTEAYVGKTIEQRQLDALRRWTDRFYDSNRELFLERVSSKRIRDCHGDLHMEHICLTDPIIIFDCIEFNDRFRYSDTLSDIAFLLMDLEFHGARDMARSLWGHYQGLAGEGGQESLLRFYKVYRAFVRGKVNSFQLDDARISPREKQEAVRRARDYFRLAVEYIREG